MKTQFGWRAVTLALFALLAPTVGAQTAFTSYITTGLSSPIGIFHAGDASGRVFIIQQSGAVRVIDNAGALITTPYLTLGTGTQCRPSPTGALATVGFTSGGERGLLGLAFHPNFESNGRIFVSFTDVNGDTYIAGLTVASPSANVVTAADLDTCVSIVRIDQDGPNHNGGNIAFGPDGYLYIGMGDGGGGNNASSGSNDACNRAQTLNPALLAETPNNCAFDTNFTSSGGNANSRALLGKMLRIDVNGVTPPTAPSTLCASSIADGSANFAIPAGNPFPGADAAAACDEVWAYGVRNPWRWSFDHQTGDLLIGDVGQNAVEEVDFEPPATGGRNYGWRCFEGNSNTGLCGTPPVATAPIITYDHSLGCSITGGYRYRGPVLDVRGQYFYADYCSRTIWNSINGGASWSQPGTPFQTMASTVPSFGEDEAGNLYVATGSQIWRLTGVVGPADGIFANGFEG